MRFLTVNQDEEQAPLRRSDVFDTLQSCDHGMSHDADEILIFF